MKRKILLYAMLILGSVSTMIGQVKQDNITLNRPLTVTKDSAIVACKEITLNPTFEFTAIAGKGLELNIDPTCASVEKGCITVSSKDESNNLITGGVYRVTNTSNQQVGGNYTTVNGVVNIIDLKYGTYKVWQVTAPAGYELTSSSPISISIVNDECKVVEFRYKKSVNPPGPSLNTVDLSLKIDIIGGGEPIIVPTKGVRIGEYYWSDVFDAVIPYLQYGETHVYSQSPLTSELFDLYMAQIHIDYEKYNPSVEIFNKYYGQYYNQATAKYINDKSSMREVQEGGDIVEVKGWSLPYNKDFRQLFAMCPFFTSDNISLDEVDVRSALSYKAGEMPLAYNISDSQNPNNPHKIYWFENAVNTNMYGFNMTPSGFRLHDSYADWGNGLAYGDKDYVADAGLSYLTTRMKVAVTDSIGNIIGYVEKWRGPDGGLALTFYAYASWSKEQEESGNVNITQICVHDRIDTNQYTYFSSPMRWCRRLSDEELGYKLYINVKGINKQSYEWSRLSGGIRDDIRDEIELLRKVKRGDYSPSDFDIVKVGLNDPAPVGYTELPNGYIRGFYVQYILSTPNSGKTISDIVLYASKVDDDSLNIKYIRP